MGGLFSGGDWRGGGRWGGLGGLLVSPDTLNWYDLVSVKFCSLYLTYAAFTCVHVNAFHFLATNRQYCYWLDFLGLVLNSTNTNYSGDYTSIVWKSTKVSISFRKCSLVVFSIHER